MSKVETKTVSYKSFFPLSKRITRIAVFLAIALVLSYLESLFAPLLFFAPGAKIGLANAVILIAIIILGIKSAALIQIMRLILGAIMTGGVSNLMFSFPSGTISFLVTAILYVFIFPKISLLGISFIGAAVHNITQVTVAGLVVGQNLMPLIPFYLAASAGAGIFVGIVSFFVVKRLPKSVYL